jgi:hypothetical protein
VDALSNSQVVVYDLATRSVPVDLQWTVALISGPHKEILASFGEDK